MPGRTGTANNFMFTEPLGGWRKMSVRETKTKQDWAQEIKALLDEDYPDTPMVVLVCHNLNTHTFGSLYETFPASEARRLAKRLDIRYTAKHGSWLNIAEIELSVMTKQCLDCRIPDPETLDGRLASKEDRDGGGYRICARSPHPDDAMRPPIHCTPWGQDVATYGPESPLR